MAKLRTLVLGGVTAALMVAGCSGGGGSKATTTTHRRTTTTSSKTTTSAGATTTASTGPKSGAKVRVVNLAVQSGAGASIDVYGAAAATGRPLATVDFGTASPYLDPPKNGQDTTLSFYFHGKTDSGSKLIDQSEMIGAGDQLTDVVWYGADGGTGNPIGHVQVVVEALGKPSLTLGGASVPKVPDLKAVVEVMGSQLMTLGTNLTFELGLPVGGCLPQQAVTGADGQAKSADGSVHSVRLPGSPVSGNEVRDTVGGTNLVEYVTDPGSQQVSLFTTSSGNCNSAPAAGPADIDPPVGSVTLLVAYGTAPSTMKLLALPAGY
jgi:hypothetical protein